MLITIGNTTIEAFEESKFALDGGAMFGIVPKMLWDREIPGDENNLITLAANIMLIRNTNFNILIEQGLGDKYSEKEIEIYKIRRKTNQFDELKKRGLTRYDITHVVLTHLHFDHCGCATIKNGNGEIVKIMNNLLAGINILATGEALSLGVKAGVNIKVLYDVINASSGQNFAMQNYCANKAFKGDYEPGFMASLMYKDMGLAMALAKNEGVPLLIGGLGHQMYSNIVAAGFGKKDMSIFLKILEELKNIKIRF